MGLDTFEIIDMIIVDLIMFEEVKALGQTSGREPSPKPGEGDIDIFVFCDGIPSQTQRKDVYDKFLSEGLIRDCKMNECEGGMWGTGDIFFINGIQTMFMYFTMKDTIEYLDAVLAGEHLDCMNGFYPTGRCATLLNMTVLQDKIGFINSTKRKLEVYPDGLMRAMAEYHFKRMIDDEDFRSAELRKDVLFYHQVLEYSIDHFLQALFAINKTCFPSRKRTLQFISAFTNKPDQCSDRLMTAMESGTRPESIAQSCHIFRELLHELDDLYKKL